MEKLVAWSFNFTILKDNRYRSARAHSQDTITVINYASISKELVNCMFILNNETFTAMFKRKGVTWFSTMTTTSHALDKRCNFHDS